MAEGLLKHFLGHRIYVDSAGVRAGRDRPLRDLGDGGARHRPVAPPRQGSFDDLEDTSYDLIISLSPEAQHQAVELTRTMACEVEFWNTLDPTIIEGNRETRLQAYREVRDTLKKRIEARFTLDLKPVV